MSHGVHRGLVARCITPKQMLHIVSYPVILCMVLLLWLFPAMRTRYL